MSALIRTGRYIVDSPDGTITLDLQSMGVPAGADSFLTAETGRYDVIATIEEESWPNAKVSLLSNGTHFKPQTWPATGRPIPVQIRASFETNEAMTEAQTFRFDQSALTHHVQHQVGSRCFIERVTDLEGHPQYAGIEIVSDNEFIIELTEAQPIVANVVFLK